MGVVVVALAVVVVQVQVAQPRARVVEPVVEAAADAGVPDVEDEPEPVQVQVAGMGEVRVPGARHVLDHDVHAQLVLPRTQRLEGAVQLGDHGGVARAHVRAPVGVDHVEVRTDLGARLQMPAVLVERLEALGLVDVPDARVAERAVDGVPQARLEHLGPVPFAQQRVHAERADLGGRRELRDALERHGQQAVGVRAGGDADVGEVAHGGQVCQRRGPAACGLHGGPRAYGPGPLVLVQSRVEAAQ